MIPISVLEGHAGGVYCLTIWNNHLYSGSYDNTIRVWDTNHECIAVLKGHM